MSIYIYGILLLIKYIFTFPIIAFNFFYIWRPLIYLSFYNKRPFLKFVLVCKLVCKFLKNLTPCFEDFSYIPIMRHIKIKTYLKFVKNFMLKRLLRLLVVSAIIIGKENFLLYQYLSARSEPVF